MRKIAMLLMALMLTSNAQGEVLFEGFYRIEKQGKHIGFLVQRLSTDGKTKTLSTYIRTVAPNGVESFQGFKSAAKVGSGAPVSSLHSSSNTGTPLNIRADFSKTPWQVSFHAKGFPVRTEKVVPTRLLSSFVFLKADLPKFTQEFDYTYEAFAEERGRNSTGTLSLAGEKQIGESRVLHIVDDTLGEPVENFVDASTGLPLGSRNPADDSVAFWVPSREEAMGLMEYPTREVITLFGDLPTGQKHPWSKFSVKVGELIRSMPKFEGPRGLALEKKKPRESKPMPERAL